MKRKVVVVTTSRSDYGPSYWLIHDLFRDERFETLLFVGGAHLSERHGMTVREIEQDGFPVAARIPLTAGGDSSNSDAEASGRLLAEIARLLVAHAPDFMIVQGDRFELLAVGAAAVATRTPLVHVGGGDITEGALDEQVRHAVTKLAHLHFVSTQQSEQRVLQMGEESWRVARVGDLAIDQFVRGRRASIEELTRELDFVPDHETLVVTFHPATLQLPHVPRQTAELVAALSDYPGKMVITGPAPDAGGDVIRAQLQELAGRHPRARFIESLGHHRYRGLLHMAGAMVGNSSSGIIEAASVPLPVVNIGDRQKGRERGANVLDCAAEAGPIRAALAQALSPEFGRAIRQAPNPYGDGQGTGRVIAALAAAPDRQALLHKKFNYGRKSVRA